MASPSYLAFDLGASGGRCLAGTLDRERLTVRALGRFTNAIISRGGHCFWDVAGLMRGIRDGLRRASAVKGLDPRSLAVDAWGVDIGLLGPDGRLLGPPYSYRDPQTAGLPELFTRRFPPRRLYELTGIQVHPINTLFQLFALQRRGSARLRRCRTVLFMSDLVHYLLTGVQTAEYTVASTSQLMDCRAKTWAPEIFRALGIDAGIMPRIVPPGTEVGCLAPAIGRRCGFGRLPVLAAAGHDTACAVCAAPARGRNWAFISCGTWSLVGAETGRPVVTEAARRANFTNEGGVSNTIRLLKNVTGLWLVQRCRDAWSRGRRFSFPELIRRAAASRPFWSYIDPDHPSFRNPPDMVRAVRDYYRATGQPVLDTPAAIGRSILESLAFKHRQVIEQLDGLLKEPVRVIHIVGGGSRNRLLCQLTADATGRPVIAGPAEAAAIGNIMAQALARGDLGSLAQARAVIRGSFPLDRYEPTGSDDWSREYDRFRELTG